MIDRSQVAMLPISSLNALEYCPRKFYYQFVQGEMLVNEFVLERTLAHQRVHQVGTHMTAEGEMQTTRLYLYSEAQHLTGFADVIEERAGVFVPVEYKHGHQGNWLNDHIQLCAQALCLEERLMAGPEAGRPRGSPLHISYGYIYYVGSRRRVQVKFTTELRQKTRATIARALKVAALETPPPPLSGNMAARCHNCSLLPLCLPDEVKFLRSRRHGQP
ncbi:MAG TPA: CRISPR-associated protein Cas4 [Ktedonobacteraceae bacterium]